MITGWIEAIRVESNEATYGSFVSVRVEGISELVVEMA